MTKANSVDAYLANVAEDKKAVISKLRDTLLAHLPSGFEETLSYGMIGYVVPHTLFPAGYHCDPKLPLPFINLAAQQKFVALYHMGIYAMPDVHDWFVAEFPKHAKRKLDMGKSCIRFKYLDDIPYALIAELASKITPAHWIETYTTAIVGGHSKNQTTKQNLNLNK